MERKRQELGEHLIAAACFGSAAHNAAQLYSDLEMLLITDDTVPANGEMFFEQGIMVDSDMQPASRMLAAAQRVTRRWGIQADQYRHHLVIWDPEQFFPRLWTVANDLQPEAFVHAQQVNWWDVYEMRGKVLNARLAQDHPRTIYMGWGFAYSAAMHIALHDRQHYESERTIWHDVSARGYGMKELVDVLTAGDLAKVTEVTDNVWEQIKTWGAPEDF